MELSHGEASHRGVDKDAPCRMATLWAYNDIAVSDVCRVQQVDGRHGTLCVGVWRRYHIHNSQARADSEGPPHQWSDQQNTGAV